MIRWGNLLLETPGKVIFNMIKRGTSVGGINDLIYWSEGDFSMCFLPFMCDVKTCVRYFLSNFYFLTNLQPFKNYEIYFLFHLKTFFRSQDIQFFVISPFFPHFPNLKRQMEVESCMMSQVDLHKFADVIFGITQKPLYITSSTLVRQYITNKGIFLNLFRNLKSE